MSVDAVLSALRPLEPPLRPIRCRDVAQPKTKASVAPRASRLHAAHHARVGAAARRWRRRWPRDARRRRGPHLAPCPADSPRRRSSRTSGRSRFAPSSVRALQIALVGLIALVAVLAGATHPSLHAPRAPPREQGGARGKPSTLWQTIRSDARECTIRWPQQSLPRQRPRRCGRCCRKHRPAGPFGLPLRAHRPGRFGQEHPPQDDHGPHAPDRGTIRVRRRRSDHDDGAEAARVPQESRDALPETRALRSPPGGDNIGFPLRRLYAMNDADVAVRVTERLKCVALPAFEDRSLRASRRSKKRVGVARATVTQAPIVLYDEPAAGLDPVTSQKISSSSAKSSAPRARR